MTGEFEALRLEVADGIARLTFVDAATGNPIDGRFCAEFSEAATRISERRDVRAVLRLTLYAGSAIALGLIKRAIAKIAMPFHAVLRHDRGERRLLDPAPR